MEKAHQRYHERRGSHRRGISKQMLMIDGAEEVDDIKICDDDPVARIAASVNELRQKPRQHQAIGLAPIAIMLGTKCQFIEHKIVEHPAQDVHRLMGDPERAERLDQGSWFVPTPVYYAYHHIRVDSKLVHIFMYNVSRGASRQWSILKSSCIVNHQLNNAFFKSIVARRLATRF